MLNVVLCWHMHQPDYRHKGEYLKPWTWLHAIKDYSDMAAHLEAIPQARAVVNFSPVLLLQLQDYAQRIKALVQMDMPARDAILDALAGHVPVQDFQSPLLESLLRVNEVHMKQRFEPYARLNEIASRALIEKNDLPRQTLDDLLVWYVLVWMGESCRSLPLIRSLQEKAGEFSALDRKNLLSAIGEIIAGLLPRYRRLAESGRVELSVTPYAHPILPLLLDLDSAREAMPDANLPSFTYPGGADRCDWHLERAMEVFEQTFGMQAAGCWPSEGAVSEATVRKLGQHGFSWCASGAQVLFNSLSDVCDQPQLRPWSLKAQLPGNESAVPVCFFRDDDLSDRIGFEYSKWDARAAVDDFVTQLENKLEAWQGDTEPVLSMIMDGENAWEHFPDNGQLFLENLYERLTLHPDIRLTTFTDVLAYLQPSIMPRLLAGSWVYGTFSTWIGDPAKNRAWELLAGAKSAVDAALAPVLAEAENSSSDLPEWVDQVLCQLAVCEASDWFWWLGDDNRLEDGPAFDQLFRQQLADLYELIGMLPPAVLDQAINTISSEPASDAGVTPSVAGAMKPAGDGQRT